MLLAPARETEIFAAFVATEGHKELQMTIDENLDLPSRSDLRGTEAYAIRWVPNQRAAILAEGDRFAY